MPDPSAQPPQAASPAQPAAPGGGQPPIGSSPATGPTGNAGHEAAGIQRLGVALKMLESTVPLLGAVSEPGKDVLKALSLLSKHIQPGAVSPAGEKNQMEAMMMRQQQQAPQIAAMRAAQAGAPPQAAAA